MKDLINKLFFEQTVPTIALTNINSKMDTYSMLQNLQLMHNNRAMSNCVADVEPTHTEN